MCQGRGGLLAGTFNWSDARPASHVVRINALAAAWRLLVKRRPHGSREDQKNIPAHSPRYRVPMYGNLKEHFAARQHYIYKNVHEGVDLDNNTVRDVPKPTDGDDLIMLKEETDEKSVEARFNKKTLYHKHTLIYKVPQRQLNPRLPALPPFTTTTEGP